MPKQQQAKAKPAADFRIGHVKAAVWRNETTGHHNVTIVRSYRDDKGDWHDGNSFGHSDLMNVARLMDRCEAFIASQAAPAE